MIYEGDYVSLEDTLRLLKVQVQDSMPFMDEYIPPWIKTPRELFYYLQTQTTYQDDPKEYIDGELVEVELLQSVPTLLGKNGGYGDCDCFTILTLAACNYLNFDKNWVCLAGDDDVAPVHIYSLTEWRGGLRSLDLTEPIYNTRRHYPYFQEIQFNL